VLRAITAGGGGEGIAVVASADIKREGSSSSEAFTPSTAPPSSIIVATPQSIMSHFPTLADVRQWSAVVGDEVLPPSHRTLASNCFAWYVTSLQFDMLLEGDCAFAAQHIIKVPFWRFFRRGACII
jgi:hypothetical protein